MTAAPPPRDSVLDALGYAFGVLSKPGFLWAPMLLTAITVIPLAAMPGMSGGTPSFATQADVDAYFRAFIPTLAVTTLVGLIVGPLNAAVMYRLGQQFVLLVGLVAGVVAGLAGFVFGATGLLGLGQLVAAALAAPFSLMAVIVLIRLALLLSSPEQPPPPPPPLPEWMSGSGPRDQG